MERAINGSTRDDEFVDIALDLASSIVRLECMGHELRKHMQASPSWMSNVIASFFMLIFGVYGEFGAIVGLRRRWVFHDNCIGKCVVDAILKFWSMAD